LEGVLDASFVRLISPPPCAWESAPGTFWPLLAKNRLTWSGVRPGYFWSTNAIDPDAIAAAWLVPLPRK
jgi:hypothetical protein